MALGKINTNDMLQKMRSGLALSSNMRVLCRANSESVLHVFLHCVYARHL